MTTVTLTLVEDINTSEVFGQGMCYYPDAAESTIDDENMYSYQYAETTDGFNYYVSAYSYYVNEDYYIPEWTWGFPLVPAIIVEENGLYGIYDTTGSFQLYGALDYGCSWPLTPEDIIANGFEDFIYNYYNGYWFGILSTSDIVADNGVFSEFRWIEGEESIYA